MRRIMKSAMLVATVTLAAATVVWAVVIPYSQDFEGLVQSDPNALGDDGWLVFGNVYNDAGEYQYGYGPNPAPNGGPAFSAIASGEGGPNQGAQQLVVYSDYNNGDHANLDWVIEANVFQEDTVEAADIGKTLIFSFDAKMGDLTAGSEAEAFIKTIDPNAGFATTNHVIEDMTAIPTTWGSYSIELVIDAALEGQILQIGFTAKASNYEASGVFYDNVSSDAVVAEIFSDGFENGDTLGWSDTVE